MNKFEYSTLELDFRDSNENLGTDLLNSLGAEGWELVSVIPIRDTKTGNILGALAYLKRLVND